MTQKNRVARNRLWAPVYSFAVPGAMTLLGQYVFDSSSIYLRQVLQMKGQKQT